MSGVKRSDVLTDLGPPFGSSDSKELVLWLDGSGHVLCLFHPAPAWLTTEDVCETAFWAEVPVKSGETIFARVTSRNHKDVFTFRTTLSSRVQNSDYPPHSFLRCAPDQFILIHFVLIKLAENCVV